jgi:hypothetical protein
MSSTAASAAALWGYPAVSASRTVLRRTALTTLAAAFQLVSTLPLPADAVVGRFVGRPPRLVNAIRKRCSA